MSEFELKPEQKVDYKHFYESMMAPNAPDEMAFQIDRADDAPTAPGKEAVATFSQEAVNAIAEEFRMFLMARAYGRYKATGMPQRHLRAYVRLDWAPGDPRHDSKVGPYFHIDADTGLEPVDGTRREYDWERP
jgi:hypothetical protein